MKNARRRILSDFRNDEGLTLVEVVAAVIVVVTVALAGAGLSINGIQSAAAQERRQVAVTIANGAMETFSGWSISGTDGTGVSNVFTGRTSAAVATAFNANSTQTAVSQTYQGYDPTATGTSTPSIPISATAPQNGTTYTVYTLIGYCYEPLAGGTCTTITGQASLPTALPTGSTQLIRAIVIVTWTAGTGCSVAAPCSYVITTLSDAQADLQWVTH